MLSGSIHIAVFGRISFFLWLSNIPLRWSQETGQPLEQTSLPCLGAASTCMVLMCEVQAFPTFLSVPVVLQSVKEDLSPRYKIPGLGHPVCDFHCSLPMVTLFPWILPFTGTKSPPKDTGPHPIILISFLPNYMWIILTVLFVQQSFSNFQLVFSENFSTCKCIFDVFMGEGELHILLLCHLSLRSTVNLMQCKRLLKFLYPQLFQMPQLPCTPPVFCLWLYLEFFPPDYIFITPHSP